MYAMEADDASQTVFSVELVVINQNGMGYTDVV